MGGVWGAIATGLFASASYGVGVDGIFSGGDISVLTTQIIAVVASVAYAADVAYAAYAARAVGAVRVSLTLPLLRRPIPMLSWRKRTLSGGQSPCSHGLCLCYGAQSPCSHGGSGGTVPRESPRSRPLCSSGAGRLPGACGGSNPHALVGSCDPVPGAVWW